jgi:hypothetical protein
MKNRVFMFVAIALTLAISAGAAYNQQHRPAKMMSEAGRCCGDPLCPPPPVVCQPGAVTAAFPAASTAALPMALPAASTAASTRAPGFQSKR